MKKNLIFVVFLSFLLSCFFISHSTLYAGGGSLRGDVLHKEISSEFDELLKSNTFDIPEIREFINSHENHPKVQCLAMLVKDLEPRDTLALRSNIVYERIINILIDPNFSGDKKLLVKFFKFSLHRPGGRPEVFLEDLPKLRRVVAQYGLKLDLEGGNRMINSSTGIESETRFILMLKESFSSKIKRNASGVSSVFIAEEIKNLYFSLTEEPQRIVEFNKQLIQNPIGFIAGYEGFVLTEAAAQKALGFQNGKALDISFLSRWPRVQKFMMVLKLKVPMAIAMTVMEALRKIMENKELLEHLDNATLMEKELFYVQVNNAILSSIILYANSTCDALTNLETYEEGLRTTGQFIVAGGAVWYGRRALQAGRLYCTGAKARVAVEAAAGPETGGLGFLAITGELAATFIIEEYLDGTINWLISWWQERALSQRLEQARINFKILYTEPLAEDEQLETAYENMQQAMDAYEVYLEKDIQIALLQGEFEAENVRHKYDLKINAIQNKEPNRTYGTYQIHASSGGDSKSWEQSGELEEKYQKIKTGWTILKTPVCSMTNEPSTGACGYFGSVSTPIQAQQMTDEEFESYITRKVEETTHDRDLAIQTTMDRANQKALEIAARVCGAETQPSDQTTLTSIRKEQIKFLESL